MKCVYCELNVNKNRIKNHILHCKNNPNKIPYKCKYCSIEYHNHTMCASHVSNCINNPDYERIKTNRYNNGKISRKHTEETKKKLSDIRIKYLIDNPDKVPYLLNHSKNESYPEKYFTELFKEENMVLEKFFRIGLYELDFSIPSKKICIEIDGEQHYSDKKIVESDKKRTLFLENIGWDIIRIRWRDYKKLEMESKKNYIQNLKLYLNHLIDNKPTIEIVINHNILKNKFKKETHNFNQRKVNRPPLEQLLNEVNEMGYVKTGKKYGVSDNSIRKWIKWYNTYSL